MLKINQNIFNLIINKFLFDLNVYDNNNDKFKIQSILNFLENLKSTIKENDIIELNKTCLFNFVNNLFSKENLDIKTKKLKYNKYVYINRLITKSKMKIKNKIYKRASKYRGVSINGNGWQVLMASKNNKPYLGTYYSEEQAARIYDIESIKKNGIYAKTNFPYNKEQINKILKLNSDYKNQNLTKILSEIM